MKTFTRERGFVATQRSASSSLALARMGMNGVSLSVMLSVGKTAAASLMARTSARPAERSAAAIEYPYSDGKAMAESPRHVDAILYALAMLRNRFAESSLVQVGANMNLYYQEGDVEKKLVPGLFVVRGLAALPETSYRVWEAGRPPGFVLEVASPASAGRDRGVKRALYASIGVTEYWRFNPVGSLQGASRPGQRLEGSTLVGLGYEPLGLAADGSIRSEVLELDLRVDSRPGMEHLLRFRDPCTGEDLLTFRESEQGRAEAERAKAEAERARAEAETALNAEVVARGAAESEIARLKARITELQAAHTTPTTDGSS
ncbi:MAG: Uma2 family endonuclease [Bryobacterales bacterium]|nr:Uma2 family endonuclease [Bryobacterales bacterium]